MRSITLHTAYRICIHQRVINPNKPCSTCPITHLCNLFYFHPYYWAKSDIDAINNDSKSYYDMIKGSNATK